MLATMEYSMIKNIEERTKKYIVVSPTHAWVVGENLFK